MYESVREREREREYEREYVRVYDRMDVWDLLDNALIHNHSPVPRSRHSTPRLHPTHPAPALALVLL